MNTTTSAAQKKCISKVSIDSLGSKLLSQYEVGNERTSTRIHEIESLPCNGGPILASDPAVQEKYHQDQEQDGDNDRMTDARLAKDIRWMLDHERS